MVHGGYDDIFPMIEEAVHEKWRVGDRKNAAGRCAFGEYDAELIQVESRKGFPKETGGRHAV